VGIILALAVAGQIEFYGLVQKRGLVCFRNGAWPAAFCWLVGTFIFFQAETTLPTGCWPAGERLRGLVSHPFRAGLCVRQFVSQSNKAGLLAISTTLFGLMYVPWLLNFIQKINFFPGVDGHFFVLYFVLVTSAAISARIASAA